MKESSTSFLSSLYGEEAIYFFFHPRKATIPAGRKKISPWYLQGIRYSCRWVRAQWAFPCALPSEEGNYVQIICIYWREKGSESVKNIWNCTALGNPSLNRRATWQPWYGYESYYWFSVSSVQKIKLCKSRPLWMPNFNVKLNICFSQHLIYAIKNLAFWWIYTV